MSSNAPDRALLAWRSKTLRHSQRKLALPPLL
jgi:hypothetical protein